MEGLNGNLEGRSNCSGAWCLEMKALVLVLMRGVGVA